eukprot:scaffold182401_cov17-Tisochrysis_lutea.AAC.2
MLPSAIKVGVMEPDAGSMQAMRLLGVFAGQKKLPTFLRQPPHACSCCTPLIVAELAGRTPSIGIEAQGEGDHTGT